MSQQRSVLDGSLFGVLHERSDNMLAWSDHTRSSEPHALRGRSRLQVRCMSQAHRQWRRRSLSLGTSPSTTCTHHVIAVVSAARGRSASYCTVPGRARVRVDVGRRSLL